MSDKRQQIINMSATLMHSKGYKNTKLSDILEAAEIGKGQFYHYFASKHELGLAVLDHVFGYWDHCLLGKILSSTKNPEDKFNDMLAWIVDQQERSQAKCGCIFGNLAVEMSEHDEAFRQKLEEVFDKWTDKLRLVIAEMIAPSSVDPGMIFNLAQAVVALLEGGILLMKSKQDIAVLVNVTELARGIVNNFVKQHKSLT